MSGKLFGLCGTLLACSLAVAACGMDSARHDGIAVVSWEQVVQAHPLHDKLLRSERLLKELRERRENQEALARTQLSSLDKLQQLKRLSQKGYLEAEYNTRIAEQQGREQAALQNHLARLEEEADGLIAERKREVESNYQLEIFNLRVALENVRLRPEERKAAEARLSDSRAEREAKLALLQEEKQAHIEAGLKPYAKAMRQRMQEQAAAYKSQIAGKLAASAAKDKAGLGAAPEALRNALSIMDREIGKQQEKSNALNAEIAGDIEGIASKLAAERGYKIIFKDYKVNLKAEDITADVVREIKNTKNK